MNCNEIVELTPLYVCGDLDADRAAEFDAHLRTCSACLFELKQHARLDAQLREVVLSEDADTSRVNRHVREMIEAGVHLNERRSRRRALLVAAMGIAAVLLAMLGYRFLVGARVARVYADAAVDHQHEVVERRPRRWLVDPAQIASLAQRVGIEGVTPATLGPQNYHLESAKVCSLDGRVFLHLVYSDGAQEFSLYLRQRDPAPLPGRIRETANGRPLHVANSASEHIASFQTATLTAMVVTTGSADAALRLARSFSAEL